MKNERSFWEGINASISPGWDVKLAPEVECGSLNLNEFNTYIYVVDTSTGWLAAGATKSTLFNELHCDVTKHGADPKMIMDYAGMSILKNGSEEKSPDQLEIQNCITLASTALVLSQTFKMAAADGIQGHWMYIAYRMADESCIARPAFFRHQSPGFAPPDVVQNVLRKVIDQDTTNSNTAVYKMIKSSGGVILSDGDNQKTNRPRPVC